MKSLTHCNDGDKCGKLSPLTFCCATCSFHFILLCTCICFQHKVFKSPPPVFFPQWIVLYCTSLLPGPTLAPLKHHSFKIALLVHKAPIDLAPQNNYHMLAVYQTVYHLAREFFAVQRMGSKSGKASYSLSGSELESPLPDDLRCPPNLIDSKNRLKSLLFCQAFY